MFRRVMKFQTFENSPSLPGLKGFIQGRRAMRVEIVQHDANRFGFRIALIHQPFHLPGEVGHCPCGRDRQVSPTLAGFEEHKQIARAIPFVFIVIPFDLVGADRQRRSHFRNQLLRRFIKTDEWMLGIVRFGVQIQYFFHRRHKFSTDRRQAPLSFLPRLEFVFFRIWRTASCEMSEANSKATTRSASKRKVQRAWPFGGTLHTSAIKRASCLLFNLRGCPDRGFSAKACGKPASTKRLRVRSTVARPTCNTSAINSSDNPSSALSKMRARITFRADGLPRRMNSSSSSRSVDSRSTLYFILGMRAILQMTGLALTIPVKGIHQN